MGLESNSQTDTYIEHQKAIRARMQASLDYLETGKHRLFEGAIGGAVMSDVTEDHIARLRSHIVEMDRYIADCEAYP